MHRVHGRLGKTPGGHARFGFVNCSTWVACRHVFNHVLFLNVFLRVFLSATNIPRVEQIYLYISHRCGLCNSKVCGDAIVIIIIVGKNE